MAQRDTSNYRTVTQVLAPAPDLTIDTVAAAGEKIIAHAQEAKITENLSAAQLELGALNQVYRTKYEKDPFNEQGMTDYKADQKSIFDKYSEGISPFFRDNYSQNTQKLANSSNVTFQTWQYTQARKNTVDSLNNSMRNNFSQAMINGQQFGESDSLDFSGVLNFKDSKSTLAAFGSKNLGASTTSDMLKTYDEDYAKSFISGVAETNPLKALKLLEDPGVEKSIGNAQTFAKLKEAVGNRALKVQEINGQKEVLGVLKSENNLLTQSLEKPMSYAELQQTFAEQNIGVYAQSFFMKANGYTKRSDTKLSNSQKLQGKADIYNRLEELTGINEEEPKEITTEQIAGFQNEIYKAMDSGVLDEKEGASYINRLTAPLADQKEQHLDQFSSGTYNPLIEDTGFEAVRAYYKDNIEIQKGEGEKELGQVSQSLNNVNKIKLYDYYYQALEANAKTYGIDNMSDVPKLDKPQRRKLYSEAQTEAKRLFLEDRNPALSTLNDTPNQIFSGGKLIQGMAGPRDIKPDIQTKSSFKIQVGTDGNLYRLYSNGTRENVGKAPEGINY